MKPLRILITNIALSGRSGTETVAKDLAIGMLRRGHLPVMYSPLLSVPGQVGVAAEIREALIPITDDLSTLSEPPDIIHGSHLHETMTACLQFPNTPAIWVCHSWDGPHDAAPKFPSIARYLAIDEAVLERLLSEESVKRSKTVLLNNCVDLSKFQPREPLPQSPKRALIFSHYAANSTWADNVLEASASINLPCDIVGSGADKVTNAPEKLLLDYDLVFAVDRSAVESVAVGNAVILCGLPGLGPLVKSRDIDELFKQNFGRKKLNEKVTVEGVLQRIKEYDAEDAAKASLLVRLRADSKVFLEKVESIYYEVIEEHEAKRVTDAATLLKSASNYVASLSGAVRTHIFGNDEWNRSKAELEALKYVSGQQKDKIGRRESDRDKAIEQQRELEQQVASLTESLAQEKERLVNELENGAQQYFELNAKINERESTITALRHEIHALKNSKTMILKDKVLKLIGH